MDFIIDVLFRDFKYYNSKVRKMFFNMYIAMIGLIAFTYTYSIGHNILIVNNQSFVAFAIVCFSFAFIIILTTTLLINIYNILDRFFVSRDEVYKHYETRYVAMFSERKEFMKKIKEYDSQQ